jgi:hypothetical protein
VLQAKEKTLGGEHSDTVTAMEVLANSYDNFKSHAGCYKARRGGVRAEAENARG